MRSRSVLPSLRSLPALASLFILAASGATSASAGELPVFILDNGTVQIGVDGYGALNVPGGTLAGSGKSVTDLVGLRHLASNSESIAYGDPHEGWGVADLTFSNGGGAISQADGGATSNLGFESAVVSGAGTAKESVGDSLVVQSFLFEGGVLLAEGGAPVPVFGITHAFRPSSHPGAYEVEVTLENLYTSAVKPRYRRTVDWDIDPTPFAEYVTLVQGSSTAMVASVGNGFNGPNPLVPLAAGGEGGSCAENADFEDCGPADLGAAFDLEFPELAQGHKLRFWLYYGVAPSETAALAILDGLGASGHTLGQSATGGTPLTFFLGFKAPWAIVDNGTVQLGIGPYGELNVPGGTLSEGGPIFLAESGELADGTVSLPPATTDVGLRNIALNWEGISPGIPAEGWGLADFLGEQHGGVRSSMFPGGGEILLPGVVEGLDVPNGVYDLYPVAFEVTGDGTLPESVGDRARVISDVGNPAFAQVVHDFRPSPNPNLYIVRVRVESLPEVLFAEGGSIIAPRYRRTLDWDAESSATFELVTLDLGTTSQVAGSEAYGFQDPRPGSGLLSNPSYECASNSSFDHCGPADLGVAVDFDFPLLGVGPRYEFFRLFYGTATSESAALAALAEVGAEVYSLAQPTVVLASVGEPIEPPVTYFWGFRDVIFEDGFGSGDTSIWSTTQAP